MFKVFSIRKTNYEYAISVVRKNLTKSEAEHFKAERMANPNRQVVYVVVADSREAQFRTDMAKRSEPLKAQKDKRWKELQLAYKAGYKVKDTLEYLAK